MKDESISDVLHVNPKNQLADIFTKKGVNSARMLECLAKGNLSPCRKITYKIVLVEFVNYYLLCFTFYVRIIYKSIEIYSKG